MSDELKLTSADRFKRGDKISLGTGYPCDVGHVVSDDGRVVTWKDADGDTYKSPKSEYKIHLIP